MSNSTGIKPNTNTRDTLVEMMSGKEHVVSHDGTGQFGGRDVSGVSACGLAALNFARIVFEKEKKGGESTESLLSEITSKETLEEITSICARWSSELHLEVEDICRIPLFDRALELKRTRYGRPGVEHFRKLLGKMQSIASSTLAVITRPPEIIACLKLATFATDVFVIFDSHPRPDHPGGAALILNTSIAHTATRLASILPVDNRMLSEEDLQWQAQLLANFSAHIFVPKNPDTSPEGMTQAVVESSLEVLSLQAEVAELKRKSSALASDNQRLEKGAEQLEDALVEGQRKKNDLQHKIDLEAKFSQKGSNRPGIVNAVAGPSGLPYNHSGTLDSEAGQGPSDCWPCLPPPQHLMRAPHNRQQADDAAPAEPMQLDPIGADESAKLAFRLQCDFDREDSSLRLQMEQLAKTSQSLFQCGICFEEQPEDFVIRLEACGHPFCRPCARSYIAGKLDEHRFPILCPTCSAEKCQNDPGAVTGLLLQQIGITEHQFAVWLEMEMVRFSVLLHCRGCKRSAFVDRQDHDATLTLACPLPNCDYVWCKACQRSITTGGPEHSCDGSSELDHLMKQSGWKYCPSCRTPIQKAMGCNHMTCISPGCNTHFCYRCGEGIVRSALQKDIKSAISAHFQRCRLFEDVPDHGVPP